MRRRRGSASRTACSHARTKSHHYLSTADEHGFATDFHITDRIGHTADRDVNPARPAHRDTLIADDLLCRLAGHNTVAYEIAADGTTGDAGRRVLDDAEVRGKHAAIHRSPVVAVHGEQKDRKERERARQLPERRDVAHGSIHRRTIAKCNKQKRGAT